MKPHMPTKDELASRRNPIIGDRPADTLHNAACVASFLARVQCDHADGLCLEERKLTACGPDPLTGELPPLSPDPRRHGCRMTAAEKRRSLVQPKAGRG